jgi:nucleoside-diphosphate-sugar epimerase
MSRLVRPGDEERGGGAAVKRKVVVTGAAGKLGRCVVAQLVTAGIGVVAVDRRRPADGELDGVPVAVVELHDPEATRRALGGCDGVVHLAGIAGPGRVPDAELFANNTQATFHVLAAAAAGGVRSVVIASSASAYGMTFAPEPFSPRFVPIDEDHPMLAKDVYALAKEVDERTGAMFARSAGMAVVALRFHWIVDAVEARQAAARLAEDPGNDARNLWSYAGTQDAARACRLALEAPAGFHPVNICAGDTLCEAPTEELIRRYHPDTEVRRPIPGTGSPWSTERARCLLGFEPGWSWRCG